MKNTKTEVEQTALLAGLNLTGEEKNLYSKQFSDILKWVEILKEADTENIEPFSPIIKNKPLREDKEQKFQNSKALLENAPKTEFDFIKVKKVFDYDKTKAGK